MSLHIGNLSSNTRRDDLHLVFRRFGMCTIQVKERYGFVVYDYPASAEKALKTLRGKRICGQAITVAWSKQQPHKLKRFVKHNVDQRLCSYNQREKEMDSKKADGEIPIGSTNLVDESISYLPEDSNHRGESSRTFLTNRLPEDGRWEEQVVDPSNEHYLEFDRYEPYHSDGQKECDQDKSVSPLRYQENNRKGNRRKYESQDKNNLHRARGPSSSSSIHSDYTLSRSKSPSRLDDSRNVSSSPNKRQKDLKVDNLALQTAKGMSDSQNMERLVRPESGNSLGSSSSNSLRMSSEEVCTILKHYGLKHTEVNEKNLPVEVYFGSARLWPWEIIYYRRLKKGPISTENYSRRIAQNVEFGIVDKYIRSSSGWGEKIH